MISPFSTTFVGILAVLFACLAGQRSPVLAQAPAPAATPAAPAPAPAAPAPAAPAKPATPTASADPPAPVPTIPNSQDLIPVNMVGAKLEAGNIKATVQILLARDQMTPITGDKDINFTSIAGLTNTSASAYKLAIHSGQVGPDNNCNNPAIGAILDPLNIFHSANYSCTPNNKLNCAPGDLAGKFGSFGGTPNGTFTKVFVDPALSFNNDSGSGIIGRTLTLYNGDNVVIACGLLTVAQITDRVPNSDSQDSLANTYKTPAATWMLALLIGVMHVWLA